MATKTLNIALPEELLKDIDRLVKQNYSSRSEYFRDLALADLARLNDWVRLFDTSNKKGRQFGIKSEQEIQCCRRI